MTDRYNEADLSRRHKKWGRSLVKSGACISKEPASKARPVSNPVTTCPGTRSPLMNPYILFLILILLLIIFKKDTNNIR